MRKPEFTASLFIEFIQRELLMLIVDFKDLHGSVTAGAGDGIIAEGRDDSTTPAIERTVDRVLFAGDSPTDETVGISVPGIDAIVADHLEMMLRDMANKTLDKIHSRDCFGNQLVIFMTVIVEGDGIKGFVIGVDSGGSDNRATEIATDIFEDLFGVTFFGFGINIEAVFRMMIDLSL